jgi:ferritin-like metal-binding protein YciE
VADLNERDTRLVQWLNEAYAKEAELEADLTAHISLTTKESYRKRLRNHLKETKDHKRIVQRRIKALGGVASAGPDVPLAPKAVGEAAGKVVAAVKGQVGAARAALTEQAETHVRNAQEEFREEHVEIALYTRIETFATEVGDTETAKLARAILRDEQRMAKYLDAEIPRLVRALVKSDVPRDQRPTASSGKRAASPRKRTASPRKRTASPRKRTASSPKRRVAQPAA